jgi:large subunit ribosomal protein L27Ae
MREKYLTQKPKDKAPVIDLLQFGYAKLLGTGRIPDVPVIVKARYVSKEAERKIVEAGGKIQLVA